MSTSPQALEIVEQLLQVYPSGISTRNGLGWLPVDVAIVEGADVSVVQRLLAAETTEAVDRNRHPDGLNPMHFVADLESSGDDRVAQLLHDMLRNRPVS
jgi:hypothetical protein